MVFQINNDNRPDCSNPDCDKKGIIMVGRNFYCGVCALKAQKYKNESEEIYIRERFKNE